MPESVLKKSDRSMPDPKVSHQPPRSALSPADWVTAAQDLLAENKINSIEIPTLCKRLGVTKGSFYWHFGGRGDLFLAILDKWRQRTTLDVNDRASRIGCSPDSALRYVLAAICKPRPNRNSAIERSVRDWARTDQRARSAVVQVDKIRLAYLEDLFRQRNFSEKEARIRAHTAYAIMMGDSILRETVSPSYEVRDYISKFVELLLGAVGQADSNSPNNNNGKPRQV